MSVKIKVSYTDDEELAGVIRLLSPLGKKWKVARNQTGKYKKAYTEEHRLNGNAQMGPAEARANHEKSENEAVSEKRENRENIS